MHRVMILDKYPVCVDEIAKADTPLRNVDEIVDHLCNQVRADRSVALIGIFDHYGHSVRLGGHIHPEVQDAKEVVFCFGPALPDVELLAIRPRAIGIADLGNRFFVTFLEGPGEETNRTLEHWIEDLRNPQANHRARHRDAVK